MLWSGYPKEAATWEAVEDITDSAVKYSFFFLLQKCYLLCFPPKLLCKVFDCLQVRKNGHRGGGPGTVYHNIYVYLVDNNWEATDWYSMILNHFVRLSVLQHF